MAQGEGEVQVNLRVVDRASGPLRQARDDLESLRARQMEQDIADRAYVYATFRVIVPLSTRLFVTSGGGGVSVVAVEPLEPGKAYRSKVTVSGELLHERRGNIPLGDEALKDIARMVAYEIWRNTGATLWPQEGERPPMGRPRKLPLSYAWSRQHGMLGVI